MTFIENVERVFIVFKETSRSRLSFVLFFHEFEGQSEHGWFALMGYFALGEDFATSQLCFYQIKV